LKQAHQETDQTNDELEKGLKQFGKDLEMSVNDKQELEDKMVEVMGRVCWKQPHEINID